MDVRPKLHNKPLKQNQKKFVESNESNESNKSFKKTECESIQKLPSSPSSSTIYNRCILYHITIIEFLLIMINTPSTDGEDMTSTGKYSTVHREMRYCTYIALVWDRIDDMYSTTDRVSMHILILLQQTNQSITL